jgi:hypothetical protein
MNVRRVVMATIIVVAVVSGVAIAAFSGSPVSGTVTLNATDGPAVSVAFSGQSQLDTQTPFPNSNTVDVTATEGNATFSSSGRSNLTVQAADLEGPRTTVSSVSATNDITVNPADKPPVVIGGAVTLLSFEDPTVDDGAGDFDYDAASTGGSLTFESVGSPNTDLAPVASDGTPITVASTDANGDVRLNSLEVGSFDDVRLRSATAPTVDNLDPDNERVRGPVVINATVSDADFTANGGDKLTVEFVNENDAISTVFATKTLASNGTVSAAFDGEISGVNNYSVRVTDAFGQSASRNGSFEEPRELNFRPVNAPDSLIQSSANVSVQFFGFDGTTLFVEEITNGTIDLNELPIEQQYFVSVTSDSFQDRAVIIDSLFRQRSVFLLDNQSDTVLVEFVLDDKTGTFVGGSNTQLLIERSITRANETRFRRVVGSDIDATGSSEVILDRGVRYRLTVRTDDESRVLGSFTPQTSQRTTLEIGQLNFGFDGGSESFSVDGNRTDSDLLQATYADPAGLTDSVELVIVNRQNASDVLFSETFRDQQNISVSEQLTGNNVNKSFTLEYRIEREGNVQNGALPMAKAVGEQDIGIPLDSDWKGRVSIAALLLFGSVFTAASVRVGAVAVPALGGVLLLIGWMPVGIGAAGVGGALSLGIAYSAITGGNR